MMVEQQTVAQELDRRKRIEEKKDQLAKDAKKLWVDYEPPLKANQWRNLLNAARSTGSVEEVKNFIYYQMGRENGWKEIGNPLIRHIEKLQTDAPDICNDLVRYLIGYLLRYAKYKKG